MLPIAIQSVLTSVSGFIDTIMASQIDCVSAIGTALQIDALMQGIAFGPRPRPAAAGAFRP